MAVDALRIELLDQRHDCTAFSCGVEALDRSLQRQAGQDGCRRLAAVFVLHDAAAGLDARYDTLSATSIEPSSLPPDLARRLPRSVALPAVLLGRLAVDTSDQGQGDGELLLTDALSRALVQSEQIAALAVNVDAKADAARRFYERYGLLRFVDDEWRLFIPLADVART